MEHRLPVMGVFDEGEAISSESLCIGMADSWGDCSRSDVIRVSSVDSNPIFDRSPNSTTSPSFLDRNRRCNNNLNFQTAEENKLQTKKIISSTCRQPQQKQQNYACDRINNVTCNCRNIDRCNRVLNTNNQDYSSKHYNLSSNNHSTECKNVRDENSVRWSRCRTNNHLNGKISWLPVSVIFVTFISLCSGNTNQCALGITTPGITWPQGDIVLEYGQSLSILCMLNQTYMDKVFPGKGVSDLVFFRNNKEIEPEYTRIVNDTTIEMYVEKPPAAADMYYCKLRLGAGYNKPLEPVCLNKVVIGFKPQEPQDFSCISQNWENVTCSWDPVQNYVTTKLTLVFKLPGRAGGRKLHPCPEEPKDTKYPSKPNTCFWGITTDPIYRQSYENYIFIMNVTNVLGNLTVPYRWHHWGHVIPAKPANLTVVNKTAESAFLHWSVGYPMQNFPPGLHYRIAYQHQWNRQKIWEVINIVNDVHTSTRYYNLTNLEFANAVYDVRVFMKSAIATGEDKWSNFSDVTFRTASKLPGQSPRTDIGSFEIADNNANRDVYLYWQTIPPYLENGKNFKYQIAYVEENGRKINLSPNETTRAYAKFKGISFNSFYFEVVASNDVGANKERAKIFVPSRNEIPKEPLAFTKIAFDGGLYELSWKPPANNIEVTNYTIFWCDNERDRPYQCTGYLDWVHVSSDTTIHNITTDPAKVYQFAISANTALGSSGMAWASCTVIHNRVVGKMKSVWINSIGSNFIQVGWKLDCSDRIGIVEGFNIYYCPIVSPYNLECKNGSKLKTTIHADRHTIHGSVYGLKPYTTYSITVAVLTKSGEGLPSDHLYNTTLEAPPKTAPLDVKVSNVTNTTMFVSWNPPTAMNGVLRFYEVYYKDNHNPRQVEEANHVLITGLTAHRNYSISVAACTVSCSTRSSAIVKTTDIGVPGKIGRIPNVRFINSSQVIVKWSPPNNPGGFLDYYQIWLADGIIKNSTKNEAQLPIPDCTTVEFEKKYQFRVRAVNIALDGSHLFGPWSEHGEGICFSEGPSSQVWIVIWVISSFSGVALILCIAYTSRRMWSRCRAMQDVEVKLPPGLAPNMKLLQKISEQHTRQASSDSSGCSSGHESVTSSLTSNSHVSSDSGAEVDPVNTSGTNKLLEAPPVWEASRLRQRNVGSGKPGGSVESTCWDSYVKVAKSSEPITDDTLSLARSTPNLTDHAVGVGGYGTSPQAWSSTGYISMASSEELPNNSSPESNKLTNPNTGGGDAGGGYSVVGIAPKPIRMKSDRQTENLKMTMPYISLASLEQRSKDIKSVDSLDFDDISFIEPNSESLRPMLDNTSKPYVQTGLLDSVNKPFVSTFSSPQAFQQKFQPSDSSVSKPYVAVGSIADIQMPSHNDNMKRNNLPNDDKTSKPYVIAPSAFKILQPRENLRVTIGDEKDDKSLPSLNSMRWQNDEFPESASIAEIVDNKSMSSTKRAPSYVTVGENPKHESLNTATTTSSCSPYMQHQRLDKQLPQQMTSATKTDEQYSKVSVAPNASQ